MAPAERAGPSFDATSPRPMRAPSDDTAAPQGDSSANRVAIVSMVSAVAFFSLGDMVMKIATARLPTGEVISVRAVFALALVLGMLHMRGEMRGVLRLGRPVVLLRAALEACVVVIFVSSLGKLTLGDLTTITQTTPIMMTAIAALVLKEQVGWRRWTATFVGFVGVVFVARPQGGELNPWVFAGVAVAVFVAIRDMVTRYLPADVTTGAATLASTVAAGLGGLALGLGETWRAPAPADIGLTAAAACLTTIGNLMIIRAFRAGEISVVSPFRYTVIPFALLFGWLAFGERPGASALFGILLIVGSGLYTLHRERLRRRAERDEGV